MKFDTPGRRALRKVVAGCKQDDVARKLGVTQASVSRWILGEARPGIALALAIQRHYDIPITAWLTAEQRRAAAA